MSTQTDPEPTVLAIVGERPLASATLVPSLCELADRVTIFPDALDALEQLPRLRPHLLLLPASPRHVSASQVAQNLRNRMGALRPYIVLIEDAPIGSTRRVSAGPFDEVHTARQAFSPPTLSRLLTRGVRRRAETLLKAAG